MGDEILDVNERKLEDLPRAEVIRYIHEVKINDIVIFMLSINSISFLSEHTLGKYFYLWF